MHKTCYCFQVYSTFNRAGLCMSYKSTINNIDKICQSFDLPVKKWAAHVASKYEEKHPPVKDANLGMNKCIYYMYHRDKQYYICGIILIKDSCIYMYMYFFKLTKIVSSIYFQWFKETGTCTFLFMNQTISDTREYTCYYIHVQDSSVNPMSLVS